MSVKEPLDTFLSALWSQGLWVEEMVITPATLDRLLKDMPITKASEFLNPFNYKRDGHIKFHWANKSIILKTPPKKLCYYWVPQDAFTAEKQVYREGSQPANASFISVVPGQE